MVDLFHSLQGQDFGHLKIIAELWGVELDAADTRSAIHRLEELLLNSGLIAEIVEDLPEPARQALGDLLQNGGSLSWPLFTRRYGSVREMGPGARDRERPHQNPASATEALWYRGLIARAFQDTPKGPQEFAYVPADLAALLSAPASAAVAILGHPAAPKEHMQPLPATDLILDHACTLLAALRLGIEMEDFSGGRPGPNPGVTLYHLTPLLLKQLLIEAGLLDENNLPLPEPTRSFLEAPRGQALAQLARAWIGSDRFNDLRWVPGLLAEGDWRNDTLRARQSVLDFLSTVPAGTWWSLASFVEAIRQQHPDFQRPAGDYDSWFLRSTESGDFLRGFEHWEAVDGALLRYLICGPLHWLGILDLAAPAGNQAPTAFRFSTWSADLLPGRAPPGLAEETGTLVARSDARLSVPRNAPRAVRYQIARFCSWEGEKEGHYRYRVTPVALERARQAGLRPGHLLALLRRHAPSVPPSLARALERWDEHGTEARLEQVTILRLRSPELMQALRNSRAARFLGEPLGPATVIVKAGAAEKVLAALVELGYLGEGATEVEQS